MRELRLVLEAADHFATRRETVVLATVMKTEGSTYRRPGARLLLSRMNDMVGGISGGCLEGDLVRKAWWWTEQGPTLVTYDSAADDETAWQFGLGCNGVVHVLLERLMPGSRTPLAFPRRCIQSGMCGVVATVFRADSGTGVPIGKRLTLSADERDNDFGVEELAEQVQADALGCLAAERGRCGVYALPGGEVEVSFEVVRPPCGCWCLGPGSMRYPSFTRPRRLAGA